MDTTNHTLEGLFQQLGLAADAAAIDQFIATHRPLAGDIALAEAPFWTPAQSQFLSEEIEEDADWAEAVDQLNVRLRA